MCFDDELGDSPQSIDGSSVFMQLANAAGGAITQATNLPSNPNFNSNYPTYMDVDVMLTAVSALATFLFDKNQPSNGGPINSTNNPFAFSILSELNAPISTMPQFFGPSVSLSSISGTSYPQALRDYIRYNNAADFVALGTYITTNVPDAYYYMCDPDKITPIMSALSNYNGASASSYTPNDWLSQVVSPIAKAIEDFNKYFQTLPKWTTPPTSYNPDGYLVLLYNYLNTPVGKAGMENSFTLSTSNLDQLNLALVELGEYNNLIACCNCQDGSCINNSGTICYNPQATCTSCGSFMQMLCLTQAYEYGNNYTDGSNPSCPLPCSPNDFNQCGLSDCWFRSDTQWQGNTCPSSSLKKGEK